VARYTGQAELAAAIQDGLAAKAAGDEDGATRKLGRAVQIAASTGDEEMTSRLKKVVEIDNAEAGTSGMGKYEQKIMEREAKAAALGELSRTPAEDKLKALGENAQIEDDLAALKAQMGQVKLVVDKESGGAAASGASGKTQVDANVPMVPDDDDNLPMVTDVEVKDDDEKKGKK
jgi:hypothetical protein